MIAAIVAAVAGMRAGGADNRCSAQNAERQCDRPADTPAAVLEDIEELRSLADVFA